MTALRTCGAIICILMSAYILIMKWGCVIKSGINKHKGIDRHHSTVPVVSIIFAVALAYPLYPYTPKWWIFLIPVLDIGNWILVIGLPWAIYKGAFRR